MRLQRLWSSLRWTTVARVLGGCRCSRLFGGRMPSRRESHIVDCGDLALHRWFRDRRRCRGRREIFFLNRTMLGSGVDACDRPWRQRRGGGGGSERLRIRHPCCRCRRRVPFCCSGGGVVSRARGRRCSSGWAPRSSSRRRRLSCPRAGRWKAGGRRRRRPSRIRLLRLLPPAGNRRGRQGRFCRLSPPPLPLFGLGPSRPGCIR
jgi:hypothetical protein